MLPERDNQDTFTTVVFPDNNIKGVDHCAVDQSTTKPREINVDQVLETIVGSCGIWQWSMALLITFTSSSLATIPVFANSIPQHRCSMEPRMEALFTEHNLTFDEAATLIGPWSNLSADGAVDTSSNDLGCLRYEVDWGQLTSNFTSLPEMSAYGNTEPCPFGHVYQFDEYQYPSSVVSEFGTVCSTSWLVPFGTSVYMFGMLVGFMLGGWSGDRFGRKKTMIFFAIEEILCGVWTTLSPNYNSYIIARGCMAVGNTAKVGVSSVMLIESTVAKYRSLLAAVPALGMNFLFRGILSLWAFLIPNWRFLNLAAMAPSVFSFLYVFLLVESPRWLVSQNRINEAVKAFKYGFRINRLFRRKDGIEALDAYLVSTNESEVFLNEKGVISGNTQKSKRRFSASNLKTIFLCSVILFGIVMCFFGLLLYARTIRGYVYITTFVNSTTAIPALLLSTLLYRFFHLRKYPLMVLASVTACVLLFSSLYSTIVQPESDIVLTIGSNIALILSNASIAMCYVYVPELFTSDFRTLGFGIILGMARFGSMLCTFVNEMDAAVAHGSPLFVYAGVMVIVCVTLLALKNTSGENLSNRQSD